MRGVNTATRYDLKSFLQAAGHLGLGSLSAPEERKDSESLIEVLEDKAARITAPPAPALAFVDGIQNQMLVTYRAHRPVVLAYCAAGGAGAGGQLLAVAEHLAIVCAESDRDWVATVNPTAAPLPVACVPDASPPEVERSVLKRVQLMRSRAEADLTTALLARAGAHDLIVLDGALQGRENDPRLVSVVKSVRTRYLPDERVLYGLPAGWRSPVFKIPEQAGTSPRYSTYVRLHDAGSRAWSFGMVRLEAFDRDALEGLAARALAERQGPNSGDGRWDRHLVSVATCEKLLRARRPVAFSLVKD